MTEILKSEIAAAFSSEVEFVKHLDVHKATLKDWQDHMRRVGTDALDAKVKPQDRHVPYPRPAAPLLIEKVIQGGGNYTVKDDTPTPEELLPAQKQTLLKSLNEAQAVALGKVWGSHDKRTLNIHRENSIMAASPTRGIMQRVKDAVLGSKPEMAPEDAQFLADQQERHKRTNDLLLRATQVRSDIEDLTVTTIKSWKNPEL